MTIKTKKIGLMKQDNNNNKHNAYKEAEKKVRDIKGFYINLLIYFITNAVLIYVNLKYGAHFQWFWYSVLLWGAGMLLYGMKVYGRIPYMERNWEERKLNELIAKEEDANNIGGALNKQIQHDRAKKRVRALRNYYRHITAYVIVIILLLALYAAGVQTGQDTFIYIAYGTAAGWTIGLIIHIFGIYGTSLFMSKSWEERKLRELIEEENKKP